MASKLARLPDFCNIYQWFLVEEVTCFNYPFDFHFGKCSVIGKVSKRDNLCYLQNISLDCLGDNVFQTGSAEIRLLETSYGIKEPGQLSAVTNSADGLFYEVNGEMAFLNQHNPDAKPFTIKDWIIQQRTEHLNFSQDISSMPYLDAPVLSQGFSEVDEAAINQDAEQFRKVHVPVVQVHSMNIVDQPRELIRCNLQLRLVREEKRKHNY